MSNTNMGNKTDNKLRKRFRAIGHTLRPIVTVAGNGISDGVIQEIDRALADHELIKVRIVADDRQERQQMIVAIQTRLSCETIQAVGGVVLIYRPSSDPNPALSNILRSQIL
ncbi:MAG: YhbY family RNA-binding protein [Proteobacteria bacterium]|jgi:RNA-binding protein|nr:YhbY family RNA-binding protein [Pseudomonadota bacterium]MDA1300326.1 YhbY family RNA-binding protein [Pseudomonadota bacterium]